MSENLNHNSANKNSNRPSVNVPIVFFGAVSAGLALMGSSAVAAENTLERTAQISSTVSTEAPKLIMDADGNVVPEASRSVQSAPQPAPKQENNDWQVIVDEDGTLSVVPASEVPANAKKVTCTAAGVCTTEQAEVTEVSAEDTDIYTDTEGSADTNDSADMSADADDSVDSNDYGRLGNDGIYGS